MDSTLVTADNYAQWLWYFSENMTEDGITGYLTSVERLRNVEENRVAHMREKSRVYTAVDIELLPKIDDVIFKCVCKYGCRESYINSIIHKYADGSTNYVIYCDDFPKKDHLHIFISLHYNQSYDEPARCRVDILNNNNTEIEHAFTGELKSVIPALENFIGI